MFAVQPLQMSFEKINDHIEKLERDFNDLQQKEKSMVDILINSEQKLKKLLHKVSYKALYMVRMELHKDVPDVDEGLDCTCEVKTTFNLPCSHTLSTMNKEHLDMEDVASRWWIADEIITHVQEEEIYVSAPKSWMKYVVALEAAFRKCEGTYEMNSLISSIKSILDRHDNDMRDFHTVLEQSNVRLPKASEVKYPGRPKKTTRYLPLRKDFAKAASKESI
ncbi:hypothetical protein BCV72DRAFT_264225 [Rhizopus microsporus var. microsporus]|uniref:SWIM-type domain-containing protein n=2 Tax=Rhizopus microsporus TaxID=58291 RepID=A0A2G4SZD1_RHIZD|nr:uncharacterized protein RHIMIDRAFT_278278 [Rhizopus microsporus ATCC 52813]ORE03992.1 hypothetical protein BCV72DRAFT_264225 [Rhizopus microsporus var. microsporus]PHZ14130.1 hypothetical protein RHIMIDRAFT_278278 [Rhizopus microsporus ATCC 52813]